MRASTKQSIAEGVGYLTVVIHRIEPGLSLFIWGNPLQLPCTKASGVGVPWFDPYPEMPCGEILRLMMPSTWQHGDIRVTMVPALWMLENGGYWPNNMEQNADKWNAVGCPAAPLFRSTPETTPILLHRPS